MREIKFRAIAFKVNKGLLIKERTGWVYGYYNASCGWACIIEESGKEIDVDKETVGQYTGLRDKNEKEIYEGDVVVGYHDGSNYKSKVWWDDCGFTVDVGHGYHPYLGEVNHTELEIFSNIYENPDIAV